MLAINLLPWRDNLRHKQHRKWKIAWLCSFLGCLLIIIPWHINLQQQNLQQLATLQNWQLKLHAQQTQLFILKEAQQKVAALQQYQKTINAIANEQQHNLDFLLMLGQITPPSMQFNLITKNDNSIIIAGHTYSLTALAEFMQKIEAAAKTNAWFEPPVLQEISNDNSAPVSAPASGKGFTIIITNKHSA